jgi:hypothetical protein
MFPFSSITGTKLALEKIASSKPRFASGFTISNSNELTTSRIIKFCPDWLATNVSVFISASQKKMRVTTKTNNIIAPKKIKTFLAKASLIVN